jgi:hypothetical protein
MRRDDVRFAAAARDDGLRKVSKYTWRAGAAGVVCSALIAVAFGHHVATQQPAAAHTGNTGASNSGVSNSGGSGSNSGASSGSGTSSGVNGNSSTGGSGSTGNQGQGTIVVPAQPPAPASGGGQVTSGAS